MSTNWKDVAHATLKGAESDTVDFGESVKMLTESGFDGYAVDLRRATRTYYRPDGETLELKTESTVVPVAEHFAASVVKDAIREAQALVPGYTYKSFCEKVAAAGCSGYIVSFLGKRVLYHGRNAETHTEYFPGTRPAAGE
jgi:uncharacterized protein YbcV (DUF1398 family)